VNVQGIIGSTTGTGVVEDVIADIAHIGGAICSVPEGKRGGAATIGDGPTQVYRVVIQLEQLVGILQDTKNVATPGDTVTKKDNVVEGQ